MKPRRKCDLAYEFSALAQYNAECARGIVHTPEYDARMRVEQARFNARVVFRGEPSTHLAVPPGFRLSVENRPPA